MEGERESIPYHERAGGRRWSPRVHSRAMTRRSAILRRIVPVGVVLLVAGAIMLWAQGQERERAASIERAVRGWAEAAARGDAGAAPLAVTDAVRTPVLDALADAEAAIFARPDGWSVSVGPAPAPGEGAATHHARLAVDGRERLVLLMATGDAGPVVLGFVQPPAAAP